MSPTDRPTISSPPGADERAIDWFEQWYADIESQFAVESSESTNLRHLCDGRQNQSLPIHSWFNLKESFSADFPRWVIGYLDSKCGFRPAKILDPFIGGGTTGLSLSVRGISVVGVEYNPFIAWVARTKSAWWAYDPTEIERTLEELSFDAPPGARLAWPKLTTFHQAKYFRRRDVRTFLHVLAQLEGSNASKATLQFLRLGMAAAVTDVSNLRRDGRALRYVRKDGRPTAQDAIGSHWQQGLSELKRMLPVREQFGKNSPLVLEGSAVDLKKLRDPSEEHRTASIIDADFDLVLYSPPYLNNFDYSELYKLELWLLGFVKSYEEWQQLRLHTLRSHHSLKFPGTSYLADTPATADIAERLTAMGSSAYLSGYARKNMPAVFLGYFDDMYRALKEQHRVLKPGGYLVYMIANSRHSDLPIATDLILGEIAQRVGFNPLKIIILNRRNGRTRQKKYLRESIVVLKKPM